MAEKNVKQMSLSEIKAEIKVLEDRLKERGLHSKDIGNCINRLSQLRTEKNKR